MENFENIICCYYKCATVQTAKSLNSVYRLGHLLVGMPMSIGWMYSRPHIDRPVDQFDSCDCLTSQLCAAARNYRIFFT